MGHCEVHLEIILLFRVGHREDLPDPGSVETTHCMMARSLNRMSFPHWETITQWNWY